MDTLITNTLLTQGTKILIGQGITGFFVMAELVAIVYLFITLLKREDTHRGRIVDLEKQIQTQDKDYAASLQNIASQCMQCMRNHDTAYTEMVDQFGQKLGGVYNDMRTETSNLRTEANRMQEATTAAIAKTSDNINTMSGLLNRLVGMLARFQGGVEEH